MDAAPAHPIGLKDEMDEELNFGKIKLFASSHNGAYVNLNNIHSTSQYAVFINSRELTETIFCE